MSLKIRSSLMLCVWKRVTSRLFCQASPQSLLVVLLFPLMGWANPVLVDKTIAVVNNEPLLLSDLKGLDQRLAKEGMVDDLLLIDFERDSLKKLSQDQKLQILINERILDSEVKRLNLSVTMDRVELELRDIAKRNNMNRDELVRALASQGIPLSEYQFFKKQQIERQQLIEQEITSKIRLTDEDVLAFYSNETKLSAAQSYEYSLAHIYFNPNKDGALERAKAALSQIRGGASFESILARFSEEENRSPNGHLGTFKSGEFSGEMERAVKDLGVGEISEIVRSRSGFHIIKLLGKKAIPDPEFLRVREKYRGLLFERVFKRQFKSWLDVKRDESSISLN